ncbi:hypothetical protein EVAR_13412_1 [Eumeta japonica]|uniref:Reverse transcriptase domain-containing protein n=1 Tax=Eumeta variegata TaxID=151549 RepID=A0A4C1V647_EUMVA|nr:hypothetical protein EVAR_13412_1 [Eumeta japonica]
MLLRARNIVEPDVLLRIGPLTARTRPVWRNLQAGLVRASGLELEAQDPRCEIERLWDCMPLQGSVRQGCVASSWLFNLFIDSCLYDLKEYECGLRMDEQFVKCLLYADDQVILALLEYGL